MSMQTYLETHLVLSTAHLTPATRRMLDDDGLQTATTKKMPRWVASTPYGWFIYADEEPTLVDFPADLIACMKKARALGAAYILFDQDQVELDGLPTYDDTIAAASHRVKSMNHIRLAHFRVWSTHHVSPLALLYPVQRQALHQDRTRPAGGFFCESSSPF